MSTHVLPGHSCAMSLAIQAMSNINNIRMYENNRWTFLAVLTSDSTTSLTKRTHTPASACILTFEIIHLQHLQCSMFLPHIKSTGQ